MRAWPKWDLWSCRQDQKGGRSFKKTHFFFIPQKLIKKTHIGLPGARFWSLGHVFGRYFETHIGLPGARFWSLGHVFGRYFERSEALKIRFEWRKKTHSGLPGARFWSLGGLVRKSAIFVRTLTRVLFITPSLIYLTERPRVIALLRKWAQQESNPWLSSHRVAKSWLYRQATSTAFFQRNAKVRGSEKPSAAKYLCQIKYLARNKFKESSFFERSDAKREEENCTQLVSREILRQNRGFPCVSRFFANSVRNHRDDTYWAVPALKIAFLLDKKRGPISRSRHFSRSHTCGSVLKHTTLQFGGKYSHLCFAVGCLVMLAWPKTEVWSCRRDQTYVSS